MTIGWIEEFIVDWMMGFCEYLRTRFNTSPSSLTFFRFPGLWPSDIVSHFSIFPCTYVTFVLVMST